MNKDEKENKKLIVTPRPINFFEIMHKIVVNKI